MKRRSRRSASADDVVDHRAGRASGRPGWRARSRPSRRATDRRRPRPITSSDSSSRSASSASTVKLRSCALAWRASVDRRAGVSSRHHPVARHRLVARMQRGQLDRDARPVRQRRVAGGAADGLDRVGVGLRDSARRRRRCARPRPACRRSSGRAGRRRSAARARASPIVWPEHEMASPCSRIAWRVAARTAGRPSRLASEPRMPSGVSPGWMIARRDAERPGRGRDQQRVRAGLVTRPVGRPSLSSISRSAVAASGTRSSASASTISARPSWVDSEYSRSKSSMPPSPPEWDADRLDQPARVGVDARLGVRAAARPRRRARPRSPRRAARRAPRRPEGRAGKHPSGIPPGRCATRIQAAAGAVHHAGDASWTGTWAAASVGQSRDGGNRSLESSNPHVSLELDHRRRA